MDKEARRRSCFGRIKSVSDEEKRIWSRAICDFIAASPAFLEASTIFSFIALPSEPDLSPLVMAYPGKRWAFPRVGEGGSLSFHSVSNPDDLKAGLLGFSEPDPSRHELLRFEETDLILVPGVSFDPASRARLGRGKGYYDRYLAGSLDSPDPPVLIGVCFSIQFASLETESHDIPVDHVVTERGWAD